MNDLRNGIGIFHDRHHANGDRQFKPARSAGTGIEIKYALMPADARLMRMSVEHRRELGRCWIKVQSVHIVKHINVLALEQHYFSGGQSAAGSAAIYIAADSGDRRYFFQRFQYLRIADIPQVQNVLDPCKCGNDFRTKQSMRVADHSDLHRPKLNRSDQRFLGAVADSGVITGSTIWRGLPGFCGSSIAMQ